MSEYSDPAARRRFLKLVGGTAVLVPLAGLAACSGGGDSAPPAGGSSKPAADESAGSSADMAGKEMAREAEKAAESTAQAAEETAQSAGTSSGQATGGGGRPQLSLDDPQAKALGYVHDATNVDQSKYPRFQPGQACSNCQLFQGKGDDQWGGCSIFPGKLVNRAGWCSAYAPKA